MCPFPNTFKTEQSDPSSPSRHRFMQLGLQGPVGIMTFPKRPWGTEINATDRQYSSSGPCIHKYAHILPAAAGCVSHWCLVVILVSSLARLRSRAKEYTTTLRSREKNSCFTFMHESEMLLYRCVSGTVTTYRLKSLLYVSDK